MDFFVYCTRHRSSTLIDTDKYRQAPPASLVCRECIEERLGLDEPAKGIVGEVQRFTPDEVKLARVPESVRAALQKWEARRDAPRVVLDEHGNIKLTEREALEQMDAAREKAIRDDHAPRGRARWSDPWRPPQSDGEHARPCYGLKP